ncbi:hypothetical protein [Psychromonas sp. CD1]|uniref:hypothetical protein n=1 Tax=Psychromonas sp. CD1 TaxID=1979839 RepID=UPI000B9C4A02|nr:hypothetical protein [Psychromonas sp. CD1]
MTKIDFSAINKSSAKSYNEQKNIIKKIGKGHTVYCPICQQVLSLCVAADKATGVTCLRGCTVIDFEVEA